ncbi:class A sortase [Solibacillus sp. CAU 1738]|uniref:class A sortase n=1 Tax=Solibacillus sp. CAU 1738 TaxID=3140363 RepID=UPI00326197EE
MKKFRSIISIVAILALLVVGLALIFINPIQAFLVNRLSTNLTPTTLAAMDHNDALDVDFTFEAVQSLSIVDVLKAQANSKNLPVIGSIVIPDVELELPILKGVGNDVLAVGAGTMKPEQVMGQGNYALAGHFFEEKDILFSPLYHAQIGDKIYLTDLHTIFEYEISMIEVIEATDVHVIDDAADKTQLTLITCAEEGTRRLLVQANFTNTYDLDSPPENLTNY